MNVNLVLLTKSGKQKNFALNNTITVIGRRRECDIRIPLTTVSKKHCQLNFDNGSLKIRDLKSRNGTKVNGKKINEAKIKAGDSLNIGTLSFVFQINGKPNKIATSDKHKEQSQPRQYAKNDTEIAASEVSTEDIEAEIRDISEENRQ